MSRTIKGAKAPGYEYWSRRPATDGFVGKVAKRRTHKAERKVSAFIAAQESLPAEFAQIVDDEFWDLLL